MKVTTIYSLAAYGAGCVESSPWAIALQPTPVAPSGNTSGGHTGYEQPSVWLVAILTAKAIAGVLPDILTKRTLEGSANQFERTQTQRRVRELASSLTRNQVPRKGLGVRVPCPPLLINTNAI